MASLQIARANMMSAMVSALPLLRFAEKAMPTCENSRSTAADDARGPGPQPRYTGYCVALAAGVFP